LHRELNEFFFEGKMLKVNLIAPKIQDSKNNAADWQLQEAREKFKAFVADYAITKLSHPAQHSYGRWMQQKLESEYGDAPPLGAEDEKGFAKLNEVLQRNRDRIARDINADGDPVITTDEMLDYLRAEDAVILANFHNSTIPDFYTPEKNSDFEILLEEMDVSVLSDAEPYRPVLLA
jgi:hypothetical protein